MKILNYVFLDDYFKLDFENISGFKFVFGYKRYRFLLKTTKKSHLFIKATKSLSKLIVINIKWFNLKKSSFKLNSESLIQNNFPSRDLTYANIVDTQGIENRSEVLLNYTNNFKEIKITPPLLKTKPLSNPSKSVSYKIKNKYIKKIITYKQPILRMK